jgi:hypothetical protein
VKIERRRSSLPVSESQKEMDKDIIESQKEVLLENPMDEIEIVERTIEAID